MAKPYITKKGFLIIQLSYQEAFVIWGKYGGFGICDRCNQTPQKGFFVACLNYYMCPKCFKNWLKKAQYYPEDKSFEKMQYNNTVSLLKQKNLWKK